MGHGDWTGEIEPRKKARRRRGIRGTYLTLWAAVAQVHTLARQFCREPHVPSPCSFPPAQGPNTCLLPAFGWPSIPSPTRHYIRHLPLIMLDDTGSNPTQQAFFFGANLLVRSYPSGRPPVLNLASLYRYSDHTTEYPVIIKNVSSNLDYPCCLLNHSSNSTIELSTWLDTAS
ncbi:hypothetical protein CSPX01_05730 [Colletotrichum filicis]|nr:hypothetical protein CSPX01_05730 [Colletotrichum filicis]